MSQNIEKKIIELLTNLIYIDSQTPDIKCVEYLYNFFKQNDIHSKCDYSFKIFDNTANLYMKIGDKIGINNKQNLCFAGHLDVVPIVDNKLWKFNPFKATIHDNKIYGRGSIDMKSSVAIFVTLLLSIINETDNLKNSISILITGDEEGDGTNGTNKMLEYLSNIKEKIDYCIIGEPTSIKNTGDFINIGRRGSLNFSIEIFGKVGHVAYQNEFDNPITKAVNICKKLKDYNWNDEDKYWQSTNLEITKLLAPNDATNVIIHKVEIVGNVRFNPKRTIEEIIAMLEFNIFQFSTKNDKSDILFKYKSTHQGYSTDSKNVFIQKIIKTIKTFTPHSSSTEMGSISTSGGVTDGSFIKKYCQNIIEIGPKEKMMHKIDEYIEIEELMQLYNIYKNVIENNPS